MNGSSSYLNAAHSVLRIHRKPMHYESIAALALKLGLLETTSSNCRVTMSSVLSKDIRENADSRFAKVSRGIYRLRPSSCSSLLVPRGYSTQICGLQNQLGATNQVAVLRKALFLLQQAIVQTKHSPTIILKHSGKFVEIDFHQLIEDVKEIDGEVYEQFDHNFVAGLEVAVQRLSLPSTACALLVGLNLLRHAITLGLSERRACIVEASRC